MNSQPLGPYVLNLLLVLVLAGQSGTIRADDIPVTLPAERLFDQSVTRDIQLDRTGASLELESGELFEDDGPAAGRSLQKPVNREELSARVWIRKELEIPNPDARAAWLIVLSEGPIDAIINRVALSFGPNESGRTAYQVLRFDPRLLRRGRNEIILRNQGSVMIARADDFAHGSRTRVKHPNRSAKSTDGGRTWDANHLGPDGKLDGEYGVRIYLDHQRPEGVLTTPVFDLANPQRQEIGPLVSQLGPVKLAVNGEVGPAAQVRLRARSGDTSVPTTGRWSDWVPIEGTRGTLDRPRGRYLQLELGMTTTDPLRSPRVDSISLEPRLVTASGWTPRVRILEHSNASIVRTSIPFEFEPMDHPRLKQLRAQHHLDDITRGAASELELMLKLAQWACNSWDWPSHIDKVYPPWDALEILKPFSDGKPTGGFCQQFNLVFLQACESFGIPGRAISISQGGQQQKHPGGGHEIVELWSNEWKKWIYVDGALAWAILDEKTGTPLSMLELRERQVAWLQGQTVAPVRVVEAERTRNRQFPWKGVAGPDPSNWYLELRLIPRSNFLQERSPLPLNQGTEEWAWTGHYVWTDAAAPAGLLFSHHVSKRANFEWTLNQAHYVLEPEREPGVLKVHLETETPSLAAFVAQVDEGAAHPVHSGFRWALHPGKNQLRVWPRNVLGRDGIPSSVALDYAIPTGR